MASAELRFVKTAGGGWAAMVGKKRVGVITNTGWMPEPWSWSLLDPLAHWQGNKRTVIGAQKAMMDAWKAIHRPHEERDHVRVETLLGADPVGLMVKGRTGWIVVRTIGESHRHGRRWVSINGVDFAPERMVETRRFPE